MKLLVVFLLAVSSPTCFGSRCVQCSACSSTTASPNMCTGIGPLYSCAIILKQNYDTGGFTDERSCVAYDASYPNRSISCTKTAGVNEIESKCYCSSDGCNNQDRVEVSKLGGYYCQICQHDTTNPNLNCLEGKITPTACPAGTHRGCVDVMTQTIQTAEANVPNPILEFKRRCAVKSKDNCVTDFSISGEKKNICFCRHDGCNNKERQPDFEPTKCIVCDNWNLNSNCDRSNGKICPNSSQGPISCKTTQYKDWRTGQIYSSAGCGINPPTEFCEEKGFNTDSNRVEIVCYCKGENCNAMYPSANLIGAADKSLWCLQCHHSQNNEDLLCEQGARNPTLCAKSDGSINELAKTCLTTTKKRNGNVIAVSRGCSPLVREICQDSIEGNDITRTRTCYCKHDMCNQIRGEKLGNALEIKHLKCLKCFHNDAVENEWDLDCKNGTSPLVECDGGKEGARSCFYSEYKVHFKSGLKIQRGCSSKSEAHGLFRNCEVTYVNNIVDNFQRAKLERRTCYCYTEGCNKNIPGGRKCPQCHYKNRGCSDLDSSVVKVCENYKGAALASCLTTKLADGETGDLIGYTRECMDYNKDGCQEPQKYEGYIKTKCFCNDENCSAIKENWSSTEQSGTQNDQESKLSWPVIIFIIVVAIVSIMAIGIFLCRKRRRRQQGSY